MEDEVIRLFDSNGTTLLDSIHADYEDSFCLEAFGDLARAHYESEPKGTKCFIIARVQTWDHKQPDRAFYSYYNAFELNKILFQTQVYLGKNLIHRLHVLNPLTNTDIIGNVQYFMVRIANSSADSSSPSEESTKTVKDADVVASQPGGPPKAENEPVPLVKRKLSIQIPLQRLPTHPPAEGLRGAQLMGLDPSPTVKAIESGAPSTWTMASPAVIEDLDAEDPKSPRRRRLSLKPVSTAIVPARRQSMAPATRKASIVALPSPTRKATLKEAEEGAVQHPHSADAPNPRNRLHSISYAGASPMSIDPSVIGRRHSLSPTAISTYAKLPDQPLSLGNYEKTKAPIPVGFVTRFAVPIPATEAGKMAPPTPASRRRSLSYVNAITPTGQKATFSQWLEMVQKDKKSPAKAPPITENPFDEGTEATKTVRDEETKRPELVHVFDAFLFATDNDFLENRKIRAIFKANAIDPKDAVLFEMPEYTGAEDTPVTVLVDDPLCEWCYPSPQSLDGANPCVVAFHQWKCYLVALILMGGMFIFIFFTLNSSASASSGNNPTGHS
ncbi:uncharacterized protein BJ171DRAFT_599350 [Polychytrium aggregatum]|uniref:uncharacterized protein n=1 Tax=Polychytrium aggregatum TaxID=110093 RepID=UPI0022FDD36C|nr:uncharacterized protein BJ171DRAFT_599350 [Polychytrium aggregatum]KAI9204167.1 hypothetical protein BJ171DRAFT_599350 [Polychytrium aggregatum]